MIEYVEDVAPPIATPSFLHWYVNGEVPLATTLRLAELPDCTETGVGCVVIAGATIVAATVRVAALLVAEPALLVTTTV